MVAEVPSINRIVRVRSEEHTSELQSRLHLVCRLLLEKKKKHHSRRSSTARTRTSPNFPSTCLVWNAVHRPSQDDSCSRYCPVRSEPYLRTLRSRLSV